MCGVVGIVSFSEVNQSLFDALTVLQHRGQDAAGMVTAEGTRFSLRKGNGLVRDVFRSQHIVHLKGTMGIGHVRYPTAGSDSVAEAQPFYVNSPFGIVLAHNGNLTNVTALRESLLHDNFRHMNTDSDSEVLLNIFAHELQQACRERLTAEGIFAAVGALHKRCRGAYAVVAMIAGMGLVAFRDPFGIRPLIFGKREQSGQTEYMVSSESVALTSQGYTIVRDVAPGEAVILRPNEAIVAQQCATASQCSPCLFEFVYLARSDSIIDGISVYKVRMNIGRRLAEKIRKTWDLSEIDVVIPIPETSRHAAITLAKTLNLEFREGFVKNRYVGRTFIMPGQAIREKSVRQKLSVIDLEFKNKSVLLVDDSIVRGTTSKEIIQLAREAGATKVFFASASPPVQFPNIYGIDMPSKEELVAHRRSVEEVCTQIGADGLLYLDLSDLVSVAREGNHHIERFESAVFDGIYLTGDESAYITEVGQKRAEKNKTRQSLFDLPIDLHNQ